MKYTLILLLQKTGVNTENKVYIFLIFFNNLKF